MLKVLAYLYDMIVNTKKVKKILICTLHILILQDLCQHRQKQGTNFTTFCDFYSAYFILRKISTCSKKKGKLQTIKKCQKLQLFFFYCYYYYYYSALFSIITVSIFSF